MSIHNEAENAFLNGESGVYRAIVNMTTAYIGAFQQGYRMPDDQIIRIRTMIQEAGYPGLAAHYATEAERGES